MEFQQRPQPQFLQNQPQRPQDHPQGPQDVKIVKDQVKITILQQDLNPQLQRNLLKWQMKREVVLNQDPQECNNKGKLEHKYTKGSLISVNFTFVNFLKLYLSFQWSAQIYLETIEENLRIVKQRFKPF